jgi:hypothetical protein
MEEKRGLEGRKWDGGTEVPSAEQCTKRREESDGGEIGRVRLEEESVRKDEQEKTRRVGYLWVTQRCVCSALVMYLSSSMIWLDTKGRHATRLEMAWHGMASGPAAVTSDLTSREGYNGGSPSGRLEGDSALLAVMFPPALTA